MYICDDKYFKSLTPIYQLLLFFYFILLKNSVYCSFITSCTSYHSYFLTFVTGLTEIFYIRQALYPKINIFLMNKHHHFLLVLCVSLKALDMLEEPHSANPGTVILYAVILQLFLSDNQSLIWNIICRGW